MAGPSNQSFDTVDSQTTRTINGNTPVGNGKTTGVGVDPRVDAATSDTEQQGKKGREKVNDRGDETKRFGRKMKDIQDKGAKGVEGSGKGGETGSGRSGKQMPTMPQTPQQSTPQQSTPQQSAPQQTPQQSTPQASTPAPTGVQNLSVQELAKLIQAARAAQNGKDAGEPSSSTRDTGSTSSGKSSANTPQSPEPLDVSQVSYEKYAGGPLTKEQTADVIDQALTINGIPNDPALRAQWQELYQYMAEKESSHNPNAGNNSDSNATGDMMPDGFYANSSRGIWQCIPSTFAANHMGGTSNSIYDPVASGAASINYVMKRYHISADGTGLESFAQARGVGTGGYTGY